MNSLGRLRSTINRTARGVNDKTRAALEAASKKVLGKGQVHTGFWECYEPIPERLHRAVRRALRTSFMSQIPSLSSPQECLIEEIQVTGHSLGGALASFAALDLATYVLPSVNHCRHRCRTMTYRNPTEHTGLQGRGAIAEWTKDRLQMEHVFPLVRLTMYTFGSPRCGNHAFAQRFTDAVPHAYRIVVDGDIVTGVPAGLYYKHVGCEVILDNQGSGNLIVHPSFVEKAFQTMSKSEYESHRLETYREMLLASIRSELGMQLDGASNDGSWADKKFTMRRGIEDPKVQMNPEESGSGDLEGESI